jgi:hypothetical protein
MYMLVYAPIPFLAMCTGGSEPMRGDEGMPGTFPEKATLIKDPSLFWQPPLQALQGSAAQGDLGDVTGVAVAGDGSLWALYR